MTLRKPTGKPKVKREHCVKLWSELSDGEWHMRRDIDMNNRMIRAVCSEKPEHFLSTQKGYKLVKFATDSELAESIRDLNSRINHMTTRATALEWVQTMRGSTQGDLI